MRGEHAFRAPVIIVRAGSSPHARGARYAATTHGHGAEIIPACAGSTLYNLVIAFFNGDHPRMRGEHV